MVRCNYKNKDVISKKMRDNLGQMFGNIVC